MPPMPTAPAPAPVPAPAPAPSTRLSRAIAPDVARGVMLLAIAIANSTAWLYGRESGLLFRPLDGSLADRIVDAFCALAIDNRGYPMFAFLFAYGIHQLATREGKRGRSAGSTLGLLAKRNAWLLLFGALHGLLLFYGDIMHMYAVAALIALIWLQRAPRWALWLVFGVTMPMFLMFGAADAGAFAFEGAAAYIPAPDTVTATTFGGALLAGLQTFGVTLASSPMAAITLLPPMVLGLIVARTEVLERPWERPRLAAWLGFGGLALALLGGLPLALGLLFGAEPSPWWAAAATLSNVTGIAAGAGIPCLVALATARMERRHLADPAASTGPVLGALQALGRRSMSGYLAQSVLFAALFPAWSLGLGAVIGTATATAIAIAIWAATLLGAIVLERLGRPGPAEWLHRRLTYGPREAAPRPAVR